MKTNDYVLNNAAKNELQFLDGLAKKDTIFVWHFYNNFLEIKYLLLDLQNLFTTKTFTETPVDENFIIKAFVRNLSNDYKLMLQEDYINLTNEQYNFLFTELERFLMDYNYRDYFNIVLNNLPTTN